MSELVQEFEKTRTFKYFCSTLLKFDESLNCYVATEKWRNKEAELLTAAWWMFQEQLNNMEACYVERKKECEDRLNQTKGVCGRYDRLYEEYRLLELLVGNYRVLAQEVLPRCSRELLEKIEGWEKALRGES